MKTQLQADAYRQQRQRTFFGLHGSLWACLIGTLVLRVAASAMGVMISFYLRFLNDKGYEYASPLTVALFTIAFFGTELITAPLFGAWSDRLGRKRFIVLGPLFGAVAVQITAMTTVLPLLLTTRILAGLSTASSLPASLSYISHATTDDPTARGRAVSLWEIAIIGGLMLGVRAAGTLWDTFGRAGFSVMAIVYVFSAAVFYWGMLEILPSTTAEPSEGTRLIRILRKEEILRFAPAWMAINAILGLWLNHLPYQLTGAVRTAGQNLTGGFSGQSVGTVFAGYALLFSLGVFLWGLAFVRMRRVIIMMMANCGVFIATAAVYGINHTSFDAGGIVVTLLIVLTIGVLVESGFTPAALGYLADISEHYTEDRGAIMGLYSVLLGVGQLIGGGIGGPFAELWGVDGIILLTLLLGIIALITIVRLYQIENHLGIGQQYSESNKLA